VTRAVGPLRRAPLRTLRRIPWSRPSNGSDYSSWLTVVGTSFILGFDINQANGQPAQILTELTITFYDGSNVQLSDYTMTGLPLAVDANANGNGFADYVVAAGCSGTVTGTGIGATCSQYLPFLVPNGTTKNRHDVQHVGRQ
jgi:hypothetical protein